MMLRLVYIVVSVLFVMNCAFAGKPVLTIYSYDSFTSEWGPGPQIEKAFEKQCACDVKFIGLESSLAILSRLQLEGERTQADIILGLDTSSQEKAKATGLLAEHAIKHDFNLLPIQWSDTIFLPFDYGYFAFIYDERTITSPPTSLKQLIENPNNLTITFSDPRFSTPGLGLMLWIKSHFKQNSQQAWQQLAKHIVAIPPSWSAAYKLFLDGEADMVLSYTTSPAYHAIVENNTNYKAAEFSEGHYLQIEIAAMTLKAKNNNKKLAQQFLRFIGSAEFQNLIPKGNWMYPVSSATLPKQFETLIKPKNTLFINPTKIHQNHKQWLTEWQDSVLR